jgi:hypothetical protein
MAILITRYTIMSKIWVYDNNLSLALFFRPTRQERF